MNQYPSQVDYFDMRETIKYFLTKWKFILCITLVFTSFATIFSITQSNVYESRADIQFVPGLNELEIELSTQLLNDTIREHVAELASMPIAKLPTYELLANRTSKGNLMDVEEIPSITITNISSNKSIWSITVYASDAECAAMIANAWADASIAWINDQLLIPSLEEQKKLAEFMTSEEQLFSYISEKNLGNLSWYDLYLLTGLGSPTQIIVAAPGSDLTEISTKQRAHLAELVQTVLTANEKYLYARNEAIKTRYIVDTQQSSVIKEAQVPQEKVQPSMLRNIFFGGVLGFAIAIILISIRKWWGGYDLKTSRK